MSFFSWIVGLLNPKPVKLAIVRRYTDANGAYVGELYLYQDYGRITGYAMIGMSLDTLPLDTSETTVFTLDMGNDFLAPIPPMTLRVGAMEPRDNDAVRLMICRLPRRNMSLQIQNRFIEHILAPRESK